MPWVPCSIRPSASVTALSCTLAAVRTARVRSFSDRLVPASAGCYMHPVESRARSLVDDRPLSPNPQWRVDANAADTLLGAEENGMNKDRGRRRRR